MARIPCCVGLSFLCSGELCGVDIDEEEIGDIGERGEEIDEDDDIPDDEDDDTVVVVLVVVDELGDDFRTCCKAL